MAAPPRLLPYGAALMLDIRLFSDAERHARFA